MGGFCSIYTWPEVNVVKLSNIYFTDAAAISMVGMTAWHMLFPTRLSIKTPTDSSRLWVEEVEWEWPGIQIAKLFNCDVIATAGNKDKMGKCLETGADNVVNHRESDWYQKIGE